MATPQGQHVIRCQLCPNPVEHHCNLCHVDLCHSCVSRHIADRTKRHEVVEFINRKKGFILPECKSHGKTPCEIYCNDCEEPTCVLCITSTHKMHDATNINSILEKFKLHIIADVDEMENKICPKYRSADINTACLAELDKTLNIIQDQEDKICNVVRGIGRNLKDEVVKQKRKIEQKSNELKLSIANTSKQLSDIVQNSKTISKSNDTLDILGYQSKNKNFINGPKQLEYLRLVFKSGQIEETQIQKMFGSLLIPRISQNQKRGMRSNPISLSNFQNPYGETSNLYRIQCDMTETIWVGGEDSKVHQINRRGSILKSITCPASIRSLSVNLKQELTFIIELPDTRVFKTDGHKTTTMFDLSPWLPRGLCHAENGDLWVSMRSIDKAESKVVGYSDIRKPRVFQSDDKGTPLFSVGVDNMLLLAENKNGDICVANYAGNNVVVVKASGIVRFKYSGKIQRDQDRFVPLHIATDVNHQILIDDDANMIHVISFDGCFLRYLDYACSGGMSIDADHNLVVAGKSSGKVQVIKYLK